MLPTKNRIKLVQFNQIPQKSRNFDTDSLNLKIKKSTNSQNPRFVVIVTKNLDKRSTKRHQAKRIIEAAINEKLIAIKNPQDCLVKAKKIFRKEDKTFLGKEITYLFKKAEIL